MLNLKNRKCCRGFTLFETLLSMFIMLLVSSAFIYIFFSLSKNIRNTKIRLNHVDERIVKDDYIRQWASDIHIPYWDSSQDIITMKTSVLKEHRYFKNHITKIEYIKNSNGYIQGVSVWYRLSDGSEQNTVVVFASMAVYRK